VSGFRIVSLGFQCMQTASADERWLIEGLLTTASFDVPKLLTEANGEVKPQEGTSLSIRDNAGELALDLDPSDLIGAALDQSHPLDAVWGDGTTAKPLLLLPVGQKGRTIFGVGDDGPTMIPPCTELTVRGMISGNAS
jgi:hypothetical protein